jgi:hypothetical protein
MYRFGDKVLKIEEMKQITKAFSKDEWDKNAVNVW